MRMVVSKRGLEPNIRSKYEGNKLEGSSYCHIRKRFMLVEREG